MNFVEQLWLLVWDSFLSHDFQTCNFPQKSSYIVSRWENLIKYYKVRVTSAYEPGGTSGRSLTPVSEA